MIICTPPGGKRGSMGVVFVAWVDVELDFPDLTVPEEALLPETEADPDAEAEAVAVELAAVDDAPVNVLVAELVEADFS